MASVFKRGRKWSIDYLDATGARRRKTGYSDKKLTQELARAIEKDVERARAGLPPLAAVGPRPVAELVAEYTAAVAARGRTERYVKVLRYYLTTAAAALGLRTTADLTPAAVDRRLRQLADKAPNTRNNHRDALVRFGRWLVETGRWPDNPLARVRPAARDQPARPKRPFQPAELAALVAATPCPGRRFVYRLAAATGLRHAELARLRRDDIVAAGPRPHLRLRAEATKAKRNDRLPLTPDAAAAVAAWDAHWAAARPGRRVELPTPPRWDTVCRDLGRAGVPRGPDARGRRLSFHSLRLTYCAELAKRLPIQLVQQLMRHKSITLTVNTYMQLGLEDVAALVPKLPRLFPEVN